MKTSGEKTAALLSAGLLAFTLSACGADDDTGPVEEEPTTEQFDEFEDEPAPDTQNNDDTLQDEDPDTPDEQ